MGSRCVCCIRVKPAFIHTVYLIDMIINKNPSLTFLRKYSRETWKMCAPSHRRVKPFVPLLFGRLSGVSTCGTSCLTGSLLALPALFVLGGRGGRRHKGSSSSQRPQTPGGGSSSSCCTTDNICFTCEDWWKIEGMCLVHQEPQTGDGACWWAGENGLLLQQCVNDANFLFMIGYRALLSI